MVKNKKNTSSKETRQKQKANLKTLVANSKASKIRSTGRVVKYGAASFTRNIWLSIASTLVMTVTLVILLITIGASLILNSTADDMRQKIDITIYFRPGTSLETLHEIADIIHTDPNVRDVIASDSAMRYYSYLEENREDADLMEVLSDPAMNEIMLSRTQGTMHVKVYNPDDLTQLRTIVETTPLIQETIDPETDPTYDENRNIIETISSWANIAKNTGLILGAVFLAISILLIFNTIRMAIFSRREEIYMMKLVGADTSFIRGPFLVEAEICGVISGVLACTLVYVGYRFAAPVLAVRGINISTIADIIESSQLVLVYLGSIAAGMLVGMISARLAIQKYMK